MKKLSFLVSLTNDDNDYQQEQAAAADKLPGAWVWISRSSTPVTTL